MSEYYSGLLLTNGTMYHVDTADCPGNSHCNGNSGEGGDLPSRVHMNVSIKEIIPRGSVVYLYCERPNGNIWCLHEETFRQNFTKVA